MKTGVLNVANETELADIHMWLLEHPDDLPLALRNEARAFLAETLKYVESYPCAIGIPAHLIDPIDRAMTDWSEVLTAHDDFMLTSLNVVDGHDRFTLSAAWTISIIFLLLALLATGRPA